MTGRPEDGSAPRNSRDRRLSEALRANLGRRKKQQRERGAVGTAGGNADIVEGFNDESGPIDLRAADNIQTEESS